MMLSQIFFWGIPILSFSFCCIIAFILSLCEKDRLTKAVSPFIYSLMLWSGSTLLMKLQIIPGVVFWNRMMVVAMILVPLFLFYIVSVFSNQVRRLELLFVGLLSIAMIVINFLGLVVPEASVRLTPSADGAYTITEFVYTIGWGSYVLYVFIFTIIFWMFVKTVRARRESTAPAGIAPLLLGIFLMFLGCMTNIIPELGKYPFDILSSLLNSFLVIFAIFRKRLIELRFIVTRGLTNLVLFCVFIMLYVTAFVTLTDFIAAVYPQNSTSYINILIAVLVAAVFFPFISIVQRFMEKLLYNTEYKQRMALANFSQVIAHNLDLNDIASQMVEAVQRGIHVRSVNLLLNDGTDKGYSVYKTGTLLAKHDLSLSPNHPVVLWCTENDECLTLSTLKSQPVFKSMWEDERQLLELLEFTLIVPIKCRHTLVGMLMLGKKDNDHSYSGEDITLLNSLCATSAMAIENARLYLSAQTEANTDSLTRLFNKKYFYGKLRETVQESGGREVSLLLLEIDMFKLYSDVYGLAAGDIALTQIARIISAVVGKAGIVSRFEAGTYAVLFPSADSHTALSIANRIRTEIAGTNFKKQGQANSFLTVSVGVCTYPHMAPNSEELLKRTDLALYGAKSSGKNKCVCYTTGSENRIQRKNLDADYAATIYALTAAIDAKDHFTFNHSRNVSEYAATLAAAIGLDNTHVEIIREAGLLHDIGKIGVPESILSKSARLTDEENERMRMHVDMSIDIIKYLPSLDHIIPIVIGHHERWDGKGYPRGTAGEDITIGARCLAVADAFDAIVSKRPYKDKMSTEFALLEIERNIGTQFDPVLARVFVSLVRTGKLTVL